MKQTLTMGLGSRALALAIVFALGLTGLSLSAKDTKKNSQASATKNLIWPLPPDPPRVRWVDAVVHFEDIEGKKKKKKRSWFERLAGVSEKKEKYRGLLTPFGIAVDSRGRILVADGTAGGILVMDRKAKTVETWGRDTGVPIQLPLGLTVDRDDRVFVADSSFGHVVCLSPDGEVLAQFGRAELTRPAGVAVDSKRNRLYVADTGAHRIAVFHSQTFKFERYIGEKSKGMEPGTFRSPVGVAVDRRGFLYVTDTLNHRVQIFNRRGAFVREFGSHGNQPGQFSRPKGIALDSEGHIYVADAEFNNYQIFDSEGQVLLYVGTKGTAPGQFVLITDIFIDGNDRIYTTERYRPRVQIFEYISQPEAASQGEVRPRK